MLEEKDEKCIELKLPMPPSVNGAYNNAMKWRSKTDAYKDYEDIVLYTLMKKRFRIVGDKWLNVFYEFHFPIYNEDGSKKKKDTFNFEKCLSDALAKAIPGFHDHKIIEWRVRKVNDEEKYVIVRIWEDLDSKNICKT